MSRRKRANATWHRSPGDLVERYASELVDSHWTDLAHGFRLTGSSAVWFRRNGAMTLRLVYARRGPDTLHTIAHVIRVSVPDAALIEPAPIGRKANCRGGA